MTEIDVERALNDEWQTFLSAAEPAAERGIGAREGEPPITRLVAWIELEEVRLAAGDLYRVIVSREAADRLATSQWTVKDLIAHLASWAAEFRQQVETVARHAAFEYLITFTPRVGPTAWNAREVERRRRRSLEQLFAEFASETERLQDLALTLDEDVFLAPAELPQTSDGRPESRWRLPLAQLMLMKCWHDRYHLDRLRELL